MNLVIVESPAKANTIQKFLGKDFKVKSSYGHIRDLPKSKLGVDTEKNFAPKYVIPTKARKYVTELKKAAHGANKIYIATDADREGEAIAWHLTEILKPAQVKVHRITFDEITKSAIQHAVANPRTLDQNLVDAQQARRILDRLVGYELSPLLWKKVRRGLSAGRVQSVAVRLIVEREEEISRFKPDEHWTLTAHLNHDGRDFSAVLTTQDGKRIPKLGIGDKKSMDEIVGALKNKTFTVEQVQSKERRRSAPAPFTTSTLQQAAVNQLGFSSKKTMFLAQQLYEGVELGPAGPTGLISYMRTDSVHLSKESTARARETIIKQFGDAYSLTTPRVYKNKAKRAQEAHEAIRPTDPARTPEDIAPFLTADQLKLYRLIWQRLTASQMADARLRTVTVSISADKYIFGANGSTVLFDGFAKALGEKAAFKETVLPPLTKGDRPNLKKLDPEQHFTKPPPRLSEATLVKALEELGIGRPSTYAPTIDTIKRREYVETGQDKRFQPTEVGTLVTNLLKEHFPNIVDTKFTAHMELDLDKIAAGDKEWQPIISAFYKPFHKTITTKEKELNKKDITQEETGESCPKCSHSLVIKLGRFGRFKACSNFPDCKYTEPLAAEKEIHKQNSGHTCPKCSRPLVLKHGRYGPFLGCSGYPDCKHIKKIEKTTGVTCPKCQQGEIVEKRSRKGRTFYACNRYPNCENAYWSRPTGEKCSQCSSLLVYGANSTVRCSSKKCKFQQAAPSPGPA